MITLFQVYNMMQNTIDKMVYLFDEIKTNDGSNINDDEN